MQRVVSRIGIPAILLVPGALVVGLGFSEGGYFPAPTAMAAVLLSLLLVGRLTLAERPFLGVGPLFMAGAGALGLLTAWTLASSAWSDAPARALVEYDRVLLYLLAFVVFGSLGRTSDRVRWLVRGTAAGLFALCAAGFLTRTLPDVLTSLPAIEPERLSYPHGYWSAVGITAAAGGILAFGLTTDQRERPGVRVLAAAALPLIGATLLFTLSRGPMAAGAAGLVAAIVLGRSRLLLSGLIAAIPTVVAVRVAYDAELLTSNRPTSAAAAAQGHDAALLILGCMVAAGALRAALLLLDRRVIRLELPGALRRPAARFAGTLVVALVAGAAIVAADVPGKVQRQYDRFVEGDAIAATGDKRDRLTNPGNNGRLHQWRVAIRGSETERFHGTGAGTYALLWDRHRPERYPVEDAHSLYVETLAELGVVGLALLLLVLALMLGTFAWRARGPDRMLFAAVFGAGSAWSLHAGVDWVWEFPATALWVFALAGLALAAPVRDVPRPSPPRLARVVAGLAVLLVVVTPARVFLSEAPLRDAVQAFERGDCPRAIDRALDSVAILPQRPEPFEIVGYCDVRLGYQRLAVQALENAVRKDPRNWEFHYGLAIVRGASGLDPRAEAAMAARLNPLSEIAEEFALDVADVDDPVKWRRRALAARLPID